MLISPMFYRSAGISFMQRGAGRRHEHVATPKSGRKTPLHEGRQRGRIPSCVQPTATCCATVLKAPGVSAKGFNFEASRKEEDMDVGL
jgi:hypothetical protein